MKLRAFSTRSIFTLAASTLLVLGGTTLATTPAYAKKTAPAATCSPDLKHRTPQEAIAEHIALLQAGMLDQAMCDYAEDATVVLPTQVVSGLANIRGGLEQIGALLGGTVPTVVTTIATDRLVMITFHALGTPCQIPDGSDTYVVEKGLIVTQTVHDTFAHAPGQTCPLLLPPPPPGT
jgi:hypothetical protein